MVKDIIKLSRDREVEKRMIVEVGNALMDLGLDAKVASMVALDVVKGRRLISESDWNDIGSKVPYSKFKQIILGKFKLVKKLVEEEKGEIKVTEILDIAHKVVNEELSGILLEAGGVIDEISDVETPESPEGEFVFRYSISFPGAGEIFKCVVEGRYKREEGLMGWILIGKEISFKEEGRDLKKLIGRFLEEGSRVIQGREKVSK